MGSRMKWAVRGLAGTGLILIVCSIGQTAATRAAPAARSVQNVSPDTLERYHHTDQGTRIMPAAFLQALRTDDGSRLMDPENLRKLGFLVDGVPVSAANPYRWPVGFMVTDPSVSERVRMAGVSCALCHTGQVEYKGAAVRIEGGQANVDLPAFQQAVFKAIVSTAADPVRRAALIKEAIADGYPANRADSDFKTLVAHAGELIYGQRGLTGTLPGPGRVDAVQGIANAVFATDLKVPANAKNFDAPVSYPYLWDIWRLTWLQYNGFLPPQADSRNIGETLGVSGKTNMVDPQTGAPNPEPGRWKTSVQIKNLQWLESVLTKLKAPTWPSAVLGQIDQARAAQGRQLFVQNCAGCHGIRELPSRQWDVRVIPLKSIGTDPNQAVNWAGRTYDASKLSLGERVSAVALASAINAMRRQLYNENNIPLSKREGDVKFAAPCGYKARPLIGVWATPPYLHNGSVRTIFDLLSDTRPNSFRYGSREYDPANLGYTEAVSANPVTFDAALSGNHARGHWSTNDIDRPGRIGRKLTDTEKYAIIEFLKAADYRNYPAVKVSAQAPLPCVGEPDWPRLNSTR